MDKLFPSFIKNRQLTLFALFAYYTDFIQIFQYHSMSQSINLSSKTRLKTSSIHANSFCLLSDPSSKRSPSKLFLAHSKGVEIYSPSSQQFQSIKLGESNNGILSCLTSSDDLVFFCFGMRIYACGGNGRTLYQADTYLAVDKIQAVHVYGYQLWIVAGNMVNEFLIGGTQLTNKATRITSSPQQKLQDVNSLIYDVKINHSLLIKNDTDKPFILLCKNNNQLQIAQKKDPVIFQTDSPPTYAYLYPSSTSNTNKVLVGTMSGELLYLKVDKKNIKKIWTVSQGSKGRVNCIVQVKNGFMVFRDSGFEMWNGNRECLGREEINMKITSAVYLPEQESFFYGTSQGHIVEMFDYEKMMKMAKDRNENVQRGRLIKQIEELRKTKSQLQGQLQQMGVVKQGSGGSTGNNVKITAKLSLDYVKLCYSLQIASEGPIIKLILRGNVTLIEDPSFILFSGSQSNEIKVYIVRTDGKKLVNVKLKYEEKYQENDKLICTVFTDSQGKLLASKEIVDLKYLSLHQKFASKLHDVSSLKANVLRVSGQFKYFLMSAWLNNIFNELGSPSLDNEGQYIEICYESLITKNKVYVQYQNKECVFYSESPTPLVVIKKTIFQKSKEKNLSLSYDTKTNIEGISNLLKKMAPKMKSLQQNRKQYQLLPGILQISSQTLSKDLKSILDRSDEIKAKYAQSQRQYEQLKNSLKQFYISYRTLNNWQVDQYKIQELMKQIQQQFNVEKIIKLIQN